MNNAASKQHLAVVNDGRLAWRDSNRRLFKTQYKPVGRSRDLCGLRNATGSHLSKHSRRPLIERNDRSQCMHIDGMALEGLS
jgi:hypothetical protein